MIQLKRAQKLADAVVQILNPYCAEIAIVGSIRRKKPWVNDIDLVLIPSDLWNFYAELKKLGRLKMSGPKIWRVVVGNVQVDIYIAEKATWATLLLIRTGSKENNIRLAALAKDRNWRLAASGDGLFNDREERIAGDSEESIYALLGLYYQRPEERG